MRSLPIPVSASPAHHSTPWWMARGHTPSFADFFRAFFPDQKGEEPGPNTWIRIQVIEIWWIQISTGRQAHAPPVSPGSGSPKPAGPPRDPLVVDLGGQGPCTTGLNGARAFDLAGNGEQIMTSFVSGASAFLALDANGNGRIDSGQELFGDQHGAADGFEELRKYDLNQDGQIDAKDPVFSRLKLWFGDGRLTSVSESGLRAFSLAARPEGGQTQADDPIFKHATALTAQGHVLNTYALGLNQFPPASATIKPAPP